MPLRAVSAADFVLKDSVPSWVSLLTSGFFDTIEHLCVVLFLSHKKLGREGRCREPGDQQSGNHVFLHHKVSWGGVNPP